MLHSFLRSFEEVHSLTVLGCKHRHVRFVKPDWWLQCQMSTVLRTHKCFEMKSSEINQQHKWNCILDNATYRVMSASSPCFFPNTVKSLWLFTEILRRDSYKSHWWDILSTIPFNDIRPYVFLARIHLQHRRGNLRFYRNSRIDRQLLEVDSLWWPSDEGQGDDTVWRKMFDDGEEVGMQLKKISETTWFVVPK